MGDPLPPDHPELVTGAFEAEERHFATLGAAMDWLRKNQPRLLESATYVVELPDRRQYGTGYWWVSLTRCTPTV